MAVCDEMELRCYLAPGWSPLIRPASSRRGWMDATVDSFANRCLPLRIANAHGWELLSPCGFTAMWNGGAAASDCVVEPDAGTPDHLAPISLFGAGTITFHVDGLFRTPPGWNLWLGGPANNVKDGIAPLSGIIETDWSPFTFTMNWRFTRTGEPVRFEAQEPIASFFPLQRAAIGAMTPRFLPLADDSVLEQQFNRWKASRDAFQADVRCNPPARSADYWQKHYHRGVDTDGQTGATDHQTRLHLPPFAACPHAAIAPVPVPPTPAPDRKAGWIAATLARAKRLAPDESSVPRYPNLPAGAFLRHHYAANMPVVLTQEMRGWAAVERWTPEYLKLILGDRLIEVQSRREANPDYEEQMPVHRTTMPFSAFIDAIVGTAGNDLYLTANNAERNGDALALLLPDLGRHHKFLTHRGYGAEGLPFIGPAGTLTPLHYDLTNNLVCQLRGRKRFVLAPPAATPRLYNHRHVYSAVRDLMAPDLDLDRFPLLADVPLHEIILGPGELLFIPVGWWHQARSLDFSVTNTYTNFIWDNGFAEGHPMD